MSFRPNPKDTILIDGILYSIAEHPAAPGSPYGQEGRAGIVYQLSATDNSLHALKVFKPRFRNPSLVGLSQNIRGFSKIPGLEVCHREVLTPRHNRDLLRDNPDLIFAVIMPWIPGLTWMEILNERRALSPQESLFLAKAFVEVLGGLEENGIAHCDLSGSNIIISGLENHNLTLPSVSLVDIEQLYAPGLSKPQILPSGSSGYSHHTSAEGQWKAAADRFAGSVILAEMLGWCEERVRKAAEGEAYFSEKETQQECKRYDLLLSTLRNYWGEHISTIFERAWHSDTLEDCPTFGEWCISLPETAPAVSARESITFFEGNREIPAGAATIEEQAVPRERQVLKEHREDEWDVQRDSPKNILRISVLLGSLLLFFCICLGGSTGLISGIFAINKAGYPAIASTSTSISTFTHTLTPTRTASPTQPLSTAAPADINFPRMKLFITNSSSGGVSVFDTYTNSIVTTIPTGAIAQGIVSNRERTLAYTADSNKNQVSVIDMANYSVKTTIAVGQGPVIPAISAKDDRLYVTNFNSSSVSVIDTHSNAVIETIKNVPYPWGIAVSPDGSQIAVSLYWNHEVWIYDTSRFTRVAIISVGNNPEGLIYDPDGTRLFVANLSSSSVSVINIGSYTIVQNIHVGKTTGTNPVLFDLNSDYSLLYVANYDSGTVSEISMSNGKVLREFTVRYGCVDVEVIEQYLYVTTPPNNSVSVVDLSSGEMVKTIFGFHNPHSIT
jgi:YVTN family beta-propeller protein